MPWPKGKPRSKESKEKQRQSMLRRSISFEERFWAKVDKNGPLNLSLGTHCWLFPAYPNTNGYGQFWLDGRLQGAHRISYELDRGPIPKDPNGKKLGLDHNRHCPKNCVNPAHLRVVTQKQNMENQDRVRGVSWYRQRQKWRVYTKHNGRMYHGGHFADKAEAEQAAINLRNKLFTHNDADRL